MGCLVYYLLLLKYEYVNFVNQLTIWNINHQPLQAAFQESASAMRRAQQAVTTAQQLLEVEGGPPGTWLRCEKIRNWAFTMIFWRFYQPPVLSREF